MADAKPCWLLRSHGRALADAAALFQGTASPTSGACAVGIDAWAGSDPKKTASLPAE